MKLLRKIKNVIKNPSNIIIYLNDKGIRLQNDKNYLKMLYKKRFGRNLRLNNPQTFTEKVQWLKLYNRNPEYPKMVDKITAKEYVSKIIGEEYIIPTIGIYEKFDDIDFSKLPNQFVIKCNHDSASVVICKDKSTLDIKKTKQKIDRCLNKNYYSVGREWVYKSIRPMIIVEKYMKDENSASLKDYKFFCFNGKPEILYISEGLENHETARMSFFDMDFNLTDIKRKDYKLLEYMPTKPANFDKMKEFSKLLSRNIPHLRVDFYEVNGKLYFGELTFYSGSGFIPFESYEWDKKLGDMLELPKRKKEVRDEK